MADGHSRVETLASRAARWNAAMRSSQSGELMICDDVLSVLDAWETYQAEVDGKTASAWSVETFGPGKSVGYWRRRQEALDVLEPKRDGSARRRLSTGAAVYIAGRPESQVEAIYKACIAKALRQNGNPLTKAQAVELVRELFPGKPVDHTCAGCEQLRANCERLRSILAAYDISEHESV